MAQESKTWVYASNRSNKKKSGGIHVYIDSDTLNESLDNANIERNCKLMIKRYPLKPFSKDKKNVGIAQILLKIKKVKR